MTRFRFFGILALLAAFLTAWLVVFMGGTTMGWVGLFDRENARVETRNTPDQEVGQDALGQRRVASFLPADERDSLHPVERAVARGQVLDSRLSNESGENRWVRTRLIRSEIQSRLLRVVEEWTIDPVTEKATVQQRDLYLADQLIVRTKAGVTEEALDKSLSVLGMRLGKSLGPDLYTVSLPEATLEAVPTALESIGELSDLIEGVEVDGVGFGAGNPDDVQFSNQWGDHNTGQSSGAVDADVDAPEFWALSGVSAVGRLFKAARKNQSAAPSSLVRLFSNRVGSNVLRSTVHHFGWGYRTGVHRSGAVLTGKRTSFALA